MPTTIKGPAIAAMYKRAAQPLVDAITHPSPHHGGARRALRSIGRMVKRASIAAAVACAIVMTPPEVLAEAEHAPGDSHEREYLIKAAFLYNFAKFTDWPEHAFAGDAPQLTVCVLGDDPFGATLGTIEGKSIQGRVLRTQRLRAADEAKQCHLLFISASEEERLPHVIEAVGSAPVLTVAELPHFAQAGGIIKLKTVDNKVRFEINAEVAARAGLRLSSQLLRLAELATSHETRKSVDARLR